MIITGWLLIILNVWKVDWSKACLQGILTPGWLSHSKSKERERSRSSSGSSPSRDDKDRRRTGKEEEEGKPHHEQKDYPGYQGPGLRARGTFVSN